MFSVQIVHRVGVDSRVALHQVACIEVHGLVYRLVVFFIIFAHVARSKSFYDFLEQLHVLVRHLQELRVALNIQILLMV